MANIAISNFEIIFIFQQQERIANSLFLEKANDEYDYIL